MPAPLFIDNSLLSTVDCSTNLALAHIHNYTSLTDRAALQAGTATHAALDSWFQHKDAKAALAIFEAQYADFAAEAVEDPEDRLTYENTSGILENWIATKGVELIKDVEIIPGFVEVGFAFPLGMGDALKLTKIDLESKLADNMGVADPATLKTRFASVPGAEFVFVGRFDLLVRWHGQVYVWENKTSGSVRFLKETLRYSSQLSGYLWAAKKMVSLITQPMATVDVSGVLVNAIEYKKLPKSDYKCKTHGTKYTECKYFHADHAFLGPMGRSPEMLVEWEKTALNLAKRYRDLVTGYPKLSSVPKLRTQGQFIYNRCPNCAFKDFCLAGRPMDAIDSMLRVEPWSPFDSVIQESQNLFMAGAKVTR